MNGRPRTRRVRELLSRRAAQRRLDEWDVTATLPKRTGQSLWVNVARMKLMTLCHIVLVERPPCGAPENARPRRRFRFTYSAPVNPLRG
jgi:hypothetical protein